MKKLIYKKDPMSEYQISLPEEIYSSLLAAACAKGISPADWIASQLTTASAGASTIASTADLIGAIDSQQEPHQNYETTFLGEAIADKLAKQGIKRP